jgi:ABC-type transport system involved in cytochrome bd biosynthesis fused ATPase/permease subunit
LSLSVNAEGMAVARRKSLRASLQVVVMTIAWSLFLLAVAGWEVSQGETDGLFWLLCLCAVTGFWLAIRFAIARRRDV